MFKVLKNLNRSPQVAVRKFGQPNAKEECALNRGGKYSLVFVWTVTCQTVSFFSLRPERIDELRHSFTWLSDIFPVFQRYIQISYGYIREVRQLCMGRSIVKLLLNAETATQITLQCSPRCPPLYVNFLISLLQCVVTALDIFRELKGEMRDLCAEQCVTALIDPSMFPISMFEDVRFRDGHMELTRVGQQVLTLLL